LHICCIRARAVKEKITVVREIAKIYEQGNSICGSLPKEQGAICCRLFNNVVLAVEMKK